MNLLQSTEIDVFSIVDYGWRASRCSRRCRVAVPQLRKTSMTTITPATTIPAIVTRGAIIARRRRGDHGRRSEDAGRTIVAAMPRLAEYISTIRASVEAGTPEKAHRSLDESGDRCAPS